MAEKQVELRKVEAQLFEIETTHKKAMQPEVYATESAKRTIKGKILDLQEESTRINGRIAATRRSIEAYTADMQKLRGQYNIEYDKEFSFEQSSTCPTCGQALPEDRLMAARERAEKDFNSAKANNLAYIQTSGKELKAKADNLQIEIDEDLKRIEQAQERKAGLEADFEKADRLLLDIHDSLDDFKNRSDHTALIEQAGSIKNEIECLRKGQHADVTPIKQAIASAEIERDEIQERINCVNQSKIGQQRIEQLKAQERELAAEYERLEGELYLCEQFTKAQADLLGNRINSKFKLVSFKLFETQINGGITPICETTYKGIPYSTGLNHGARINGGMDIINTLSEHYGLSLPIVIDNSEAVTKLIDVQGQVIRLVVSEQDKQLRIETCESNGNGNKHKAHAEQMALI